LLELVDTVLDLLPLAHPTDVPHVEPAPQSDDGGGASPVLVGGGVLATLVLAGGLIWVRQRAEAAAALERDAQADGDEQGTGAAVEPGDDARA
jgi:hypothetical protein